MFEVAKTHLPSAMLLAFANMAIGSPLFPTFVAKLISTPIKI